MRNNIQMRHHATRRNDGILTNALHLDQASQVLFYVHNVDTELVLVATLNP